MEELDKDLIQRVGRFASCDISGVSAFIGGIVAQEVVKKTGKYTPLNQWLICDFLEATTKEDVDRSPKGCR